MRPSSGAARSGFTLVEMVVVVAILGILASAALAFSHAASQRARELELRRDLRILREGIDRFKLEYDKARNNENDAREAFKTRVVVDRTGYPLTLEEMVELKILRRVPRDPMTRDGEWVTMSFSDDPDSSMTDGRDVFDVRSRSTRRALDGTTYDTW
jgi:general secretion pathway protein G